MTGVPEEASAAAPMAAIDVMAARLRNLSSPTLLDLVDQADTLKEAISSVRVHAAMISAALAGGAARPDDVLEAIKDLVLSLGSADNDMSVLHDQLDSIHQEQQRAG